MVSPRKESVSWNNSPSVAYVRRILNSRFGCDIVVIHCLLLCYDVFTCTSRSFTTIHYRFFTTVTYCVLLCSAVFYCDPLSLIVLHGLLL